MELHLGKQHKPQAFPAVCTADTFSLEDHFQAQNSLLQLASLISSVMVTCCFLNVALISCISPFAEQPCLLLLSPQRKRNKGREGPGLMMDKRILLCVSLGWQIWSAAPAHRALPKSKGMI